MAQLKKLAFIGIIMVVASAITMAEMDSVTTRPYKVLFDLGIPRDYYSSRADPPKETEDLSGSQGVDYIIYLTNDTKKTSVAVIGS